MSANTQQSISCQRTKRYAQEWNEMPASLPKRAPRFIRRHEVGSHFLARSSLGVGGCSMKITEEVRKFAAEQKLCQTTKRCEPEWNKNRESFPNRVRRFTRRSECIKIQL